MQNNPLISIITPCYHSEKWIERYLTCILNQTYDNIELIVINDGSTDETERIVLSYQKRFEEKGATLRYQWQQNKGLGGAINTGLKLITGEYFTWCDSDNFYTNDYIETKKNFFEANPDIDIVRCDGYVVFDSNIDKPIGFMSKRNIDKESQHLFLNALLIQNFHFGCAMLKTKSFDQINPTRDIYESREGQNWQLMLPMLYHYKCGYIDRQMFYFVIRKDSISNVAFQKGLKERVDQINEYIKILTVTLQSMHLEKGEEQNYIKLITVKYAKEKIKLAISFNDIPLLVSQQQLLKETQSLTVQDTLRYLNGRYILCHPLFYPLQQSAFRFGRKVKRMLVK